MNRLPISISKTGGEPAVPVSELFRSILISISGFGIATFANLLAPQVAAGLKNEKYAFGFLVFDRGSFYCFALLLIIFVYLILGMRAYYHADKRLHYVKQSAFRFALGAALALYDVAGTKLELTPQPFFPGPAQILESFLMEAGYIGTNLLYSLRLFSAGFLLGVLLGVSVGILIGWFPKAYYWVYPVLKIIGVIPAVAWMPFALTVFPTPFAAAVFLIAICSWFPVASQTAFGIQPTPKLQFEAARTLGGNTVYLVFHVTVPHAMPQIFSGITTACARSFTCLVMAEMMGRPGGLGYYINVSKVWAAYYKFCRYFSDSDFIQCVFQQGSLFPWLTVEQNISAGLKARHVYREQKDKVSYYIHLIGLDGFEKAYPHQISGGMAQRVAIARALINGLDVLLLDEPMGALDSFTRADFQDKLLEIRKENDAAMILVTHDVDEAIYLSDRIVIMTPRPGEISEVLEVRLPHPRDRGGLEFLNLWWDIMDRFHPASAEPKPEYYI